MDAIAVEKLTMETRHDAQAVTTTAPAAEVVAVMDGKSVALMITRRRALLGWDPL